MVLQQVFSTEAAKLPDEKAAQLIAAVSAADRKAVRKLLEEGVSPNVRDGDGNTPLMIAARIDNNITITGMLLGRGADVNAANNRGETALMSALAAGEQMTRLLLSFNADPLVVIDTAKREKLLSCAVTSGAEKAFDALLGAGVAHTITNASKETLLYLAAKNADPKMTEKLLALGISPNACTAKGFSPLRAAMGHQNPALEAQALECVRLLVEADADPTNEVADRAGWTDNTHVDNGYAASIGGKVGEMVEKAQKNFAVNTAAHYSQEQQVIDLLANGAKAETVNKEGYTALQYAAENGIPKATQALLDKGANPNRKTPDGKLPLGIAAEEGDAETVAALAKGGAGIDDVNKAGVSALEYALGCKDEAKRLATVRALVNAGSKPNRLSSTGAYMLAVAATNGDAGSVKILLDAEADTSLAKPGGSYPLHMAVKSGNAECVRLLIEAGASTFVKDEEGLTPFDHAYAARHIRDKIFELVDDRRDAELKVWAEDSIRTTDSTSSMKTLKFKPKAPS